MYNNGYLDGFSDTIEALKNRGIELTDELVDEVYEELLTKGD